MDSNKFENLKSDKVFVESSVKLKNINSALRLNWDEFYWSMYGGEKIDDALYPEWIPPIVCYYHAYCLARETYRNDLDFFDKLISDKRMKSVWETVNKRRKNDTEALNLIEKILFGISGPDNLEKLPKSQRDELFDKIVDTAQQLWLLLNEVPSLNFSILNYSDDISPIKIADMLDKNFTPPGGIPFIPPSFKRLLRGVIKQAENQKKWTKPLVNKPNIADFQKVYFIRYLKRYFIAEYKTPLWKVIATITNVIFDCDLSVDQIRSKAG